MHKEGSPVADPGAIEQFVWGFGGDCQGPQAWLGTRQNLSIQLGGAREFLSHKVHHQRF